MKRVHKKSIDERINLRINGERNYDSSQICFRNFAAFAERMEGEREHFCEAMKNYYEESYLRY